MTLEQELNNKRLDILCRHIDNVRRSCRVLGERLIENGELKLGRRLISNGYLHDHSKFAGIEWEYLHGDIKDSSPDDFKKATLQHQSVNKHHPEYWDGVDKMPLIYLAELVCDWNARSTEFGNDLREWIKTKATKRYKMKPQSKVYKQIKDFVDLLLDPAFT
jgi:hypothetical protein